MEYKNFCEDVVTRTKLLIREYEGPYEVTLLLNCLVSLVSIPTEKTDSNDQAFIQSCVAELKRMDSIEQIIIKSTDDKKLFRTIKNALSHVHIEAQAQNGQIDEIYLRDKSKGANRFHTELCFNINQLRDYAVFVADKHLERIQGSEE